MQLPPDAAPLFAEIARDIAAESDVAKATERIVELARLTLRCDVVTLRTDASDGRLRLRAATDPALAESYGRALHEAGSGPVWDAAREDTTVVSDDLPSDDRWPDFARRVAAMGAPLRSVMAIPLVVGDRARHGVLVCSDSRAGFFGVDLEALGTLFATHAAISLDAVTASQRADNLAKALESSRRIAAAVGIVMTTYRLPEPQAFDMLRAASQGLNRKLRDIADEVWLTGRVPDFTAAPERP